MKLTLLKDPVEYNSFSLVFVLFLYSLAILPGVFFNIGLIIVALAIIVIFPNVLLNLKKQNRRMTKAMFIIGGMLLYLMVDIIIHPKFSSQAIESAISIATIGSVGILTGSMDYYEKSLMKYGKILAILNFVTASVFLFVTDDIFLASMRFGYAMLPSSLWFLCEFFNGKKVLYLVLFLLSTLMLTIWGSRGTLFVTGLFLLLSIIKYKKFIYILLLVLVFWFREELVAVVLNICLYLSDITGSHKLYALIALLSGDVWEASSGRGNLYEHCIDLFLQNPLGNGVGFWAYDVVMGYLYPHNVILQIASESGIFGLLIFIFVISIVFWRLLHIKSSYFFFYCVVVSISVGRLLVSSNYMERPEFWLTLGLFLINSRFVRENGGR